MDKKMELSRISHESLLQMYKDVEEYLAFLDKEKKEKGTDEK